jgi:nitroimidazol reductase NimA-like FMN-containing flavoprotein (pyridoxamine 5'-phosphate oxidase superfamily)
METKRSQIKRHPERSVPNEATEILAEGLVAHIGFCRNEQPFVIPFSYHYDPTKPDKLYLHGAPASRALQHIGNGAAVCVSVTLLDGLVYSRSAKYHSINYRSVVLFGTARIITEESDKRTIFEQMIGRYFIGRKAGQDYDPPPSEHLNSTLMVEVQIEESNAKARRGGPAGPHDADPDALGTCGVLLMGKEFSK